MKGLTQKDQSSKIDKTVTIYTGERLCEKYT